MHPCATFYRRLRRRGLCLWNLFSIRLARAPLARAYVSSIGLFFYSVTRYPRAFMFRYTPLEASHVLASLERLAGGFAPGPPSQLATVAPLDSTPPERGHELRIVGHVLEPLVIVIVAEHPLEPTAALDEPHAPDRR